MIELTSKESMNMRPHSPGIKSSQGALKKTGGNRKWKYINQTVRLNVLRTCKEMHTMWNMHIRYIACAKWLMFFNLKVILKWAWNVKHYNLWKCRQCRIKESKVWIWKYFRRSVNEKMKFALTVRLKPCMWQVAHVYWIICNPLNEEGQRQNKMILKGNQLIKRMQWKQRHIWAGHKHEWIDYNSGKKLS